MFIDRTQISDRISEDDDKPEKKVEYLPYEIGYMSATIISIAEKELNETEEKRISSLQQLRILIENEKNLYMRTDDNFLLQFLRVRKFDVAKAFKNIQNYYRFRTKHAFYNNESNATVHEVFRKNFIGFLPYRDKGGSVIILCKLGMWDPEEVPRDLLLWTVTHCMIHSLEDPATQVLGYSVIIDLRGVGYKHLKQCTLENFILLLHTSQSVLPARIKGIHLIGMPQIFSSIWNIAYPFILKSKLKKRVHIHGEDLKSLHVHLPPPILSSEYGGDLGEFDNSTWHANILTKNEWCLEQRLYGYK